MGDGSIVVGGALAFTWRRLAPLRLHRQVPTRVGTIGVLAWRGDDPLSFPAGRQVPDPNAVGGDAFLFDSIVRSFIPLLAYGYALVGVAAIVLLVRMAWRQTSWEQLMQTFPGQSPQRSADHLLKRLGDG